MFILIKIFILNTVIISIVSNIKLFKIIMIYNYFNFIAKVISLDKWRKSSVEILKLSLQTELQET